MKVEFTQGAKKDLLKAPQHCRVKALDWVTQVEKFGLMEVRKIPGFHDEPLTGKKSRSVRLNRQWRLEYVETQRGLLITVVKVHPHNY